MNCITLVFGLVGHSRLLILCTETTYGMGSTTPEQNLEITTGSTLKLAFHNVGSV